MITPQQAIERLISNNELFYDEMTDLMRQIMSGQVPPEQIAAILTGLRIKVETVSEITAAGGGRRESRQTRRAFRFLVQRRGGRDGADGCGVEHYA